MHRVFALTVSDFLLVSFFIRLGENGRLVNCSSIIYHNLEIKHHPMTVDPMYHH